MKKAIILIGLFVMVFSFSVQARENAFGFRVGLYSPKEDWFDSGISFTGEYGIKIDENVSIMLGLDFFRKENTDREQLSENQTSVGVPEDVYQTLSEWSATLLPLMAKANLTFPINPKLSAFFNGGLGYELLFVKYEGYTEPNEGGNQIDDSNTYSGFGWQVGGGIAYQMGSRSHLTADLTYNGTKVTREDGGIEYEVDPSGLFARLGLLVYFY